MSRILILGGTTEASSLARALAKTKANAVFSYAGRTKSPVAQPLPTRTGGFGGVSGLVGYLRSESITQVVDATHPFAAQMSQNAIAACAQTGVPLLAFERRPWVAGAGDNWCTVATIDAAVAALPEAPVRVFLAIGKQTLAPFGRAAHHHYLLRLVDPPTASLPLPNTAVEIARGPFDLAGDLGLLQRHRIDLIIAKNAGGSGARAKLDAARHLGLKVILVDRPHMPDRQVVDRLDDVMRWLGHSTRLGV